MTFRVSTRGERARTYLSRLFLGLCIIAVGIGYLGNYLDVLPWSGFTLFFPGWGSLFLIIPAVYFLIRSPFSWFWPLCLLGGVLILISKLELYPFGTAVAICLAILVILIGVRIILSPLFRRMRKRRMRQKIQDNLRSQGVIYGDAVHGNADSDGNYSVSFGERVICPDETDFVSATLNVSFGEMKFDLRNTHIPDCAVIDANCAFGELTVLLPDYARAEVTKGGSFSGISCKHIDPKDENAPVVYINASCSFGEIKIK